MQVAKTPGSPLRIFITALAGIALITVPAAAQTFSVSFNNLSSPDCVKNKIGVYQTPFMGTAGYPSLTSMAPFLSDAGVHDLRYEIGWGKPDTFAYNQIGGTETSPTIDFTQLDPFVNMVQTNGISLLFATGYDPVPLKTCTDWDCWMAVPDDLASWQSITRQYANHYSSSLGLKGIYWEIWNEPDLSSGGSKVFFTGDQTDYGNLYASAVAGINAGAADALVGGPAIAYDTSYVTQSGILNMPMNFASIHAYANAPGQIASMQSALGSKNVPIFMTEYASYTTFGATSPNSTYVAAAAFFEDVKMLLTYPILKKVYWAQWIDDDVGMITYSLHKKAIYNAYKIYQTLLPTNRVAVSPDNSNGIDTLAAADGFSAGVAVWNNNTTNTSVTVNLSNLPGQSGTLQLYRIDSQHASYIDDPSSENLAVNSQWSYSTPISSWTGVIPAQGLVFILAAGVPSVPLTPTGLIAVPGNGVVQLSWNLSSGATTYNLARALNNAGPYSNILSAAVTNDTDTNVINGTTYYYVVAASNSVGASANSPFVSATPSLSAALVAWFQAGAISSVTSGGALGRWIDSSGNGNNATQITGSLQPAYITNAMNGQPVVRFNSAKSTYLAFNRVVQDDFTIICVYQSMQGIGTGTTYYDGAGLVSAEVAGVVNDFGASLNANGQLLVGTGNPDTTLVSGNGFNDGKPHVFTFKRTRATGSIMLYIDGTLAATGTGGTQSLTSPSQIVLGAQQTLDNYLTGDIAEVKIYNTPLADTDRQSQENALKNKYFSGFNPSPLSVSQVSGKLVVSWPSSTSGFTLQSATNLTPPIVWSAVTNAVTIINGQSMVTVDLTELDRFFTLVAP